MSKLNDLIEELVDKKEGLPTVILEGAIAKLIDEVRALRNEVDGLKKQVETYGQLLALLGQQEAIRIAKKDLKSCKNKKEFIDDMKKRGEEVYDGEYAKGYADFIDELYALAEECGE